MEPIKVYQPLVIPDAPFPLQEMAGFDPSQKVGEGIYAPRETKDQPLPHKITAQEVLSTALNTKSRKITNEFQFTQSGALQIGQYQDGVSGDIRISPNGIAARNRNGDTTFAIDGETGDATFRGTVSAGDFEVIDEKGLISLSAFESGDQNGATQSITSTSFVQMTNLSVTTSRLERSARALLFFEALIAVDASDHSSNFDGNAIIAFFIDGAQAGNSIVFQKRARRNAGFEDNNSWDIAFLYHPLDLTAGVHTISMQAKIANFTGTGVIDVLVGSARLSYIILGR